jgi:hypothetical protein
MCDRWLESFENFLTDVGCRPSPKHSLDRYPNNDGNYEPGNCRWATIKEQTENKRKVGALSRFTTEELLTEIRKRFSTTNLSQSPFPTVDNQIVQKIE